LCSEVGVPSQPRQRPCLLERPLTYFAGGVGNKGMPFLFQCSGGVCEGMVLKRSWLYVYVVKRLWSVVNRVWSVVYVVKRLWAVVNQLWSVMVVQC
jgi:hypothetical protein